MSMQIQQRYAGIQVSPEESWNVNLVTVISKLVLACVMLAAFLAVSMAN